MIEFHFPFNESLRFQFRHGTLAKEWANHYPQLIDEQDVGLLKTSWQRRFHFLEWLGAILLHESTGYLSLIQKYNCKNHPEKVARLREIVPREGIQLPVLRHGQRARPLRIRAGPKGLVFFEIKRPTENISDSQTECLKQLAKMGQKVAVLRFHKV